MSDRSFVSLAFRARVRTIAVPIALVLGKLGLTPNALTIVGFLGTCAAGIAAAAQAWTLAGILVIAFGVFDLFDGALARATGTTSKFGAFLDSTLDRMGENLVLAGVAYGCAAAGFVQGAGLAVLAMAFASVVTYARAKAEVVGLHGEVGVAPRPERLILLSIGLIQAGLTGGIGYRGEVLNACSTAACPPTTHVGSGGEPGLVLTIGAIAILSAVTVIQRILHVRAQLGRSNP